MIFPGEILKMSYILRYPKILVTPPWKRIRDAGEENGSSDPIGHQEMRDRLAATIVRYNALMGVHAATHQRADNMEYAKSRELKRARKRRSHRAVAGEGDAGHGIGA